MSYDIRFFPDQQLAHVSFDGHVDGEEVMGALSSVFTDAQWSADMHLIWDFTSAESLALAPSDARRITDFAESNGEVMGSEKSAIIAPREDHYAVMKMITTKTKKAGRHCEAFRSTEAAYEWFGWRPPARISNN